MGDSKRIFFATDIHGSEKCFRKFLNTPKFYKANILILGGDITGKLMIPVVKNHDGTYTAKYADTRRVAKSEQELQKILGEIRSQGYYPYVTSPEEMEILQRDERRVEEVFKKLILEQVKSWVDLAEQHLKNTGVSLYIMCGNDDYPEVRSILQRSSYIVDPEDRVVDLDSKHQMLSVGCSNPTPWKTPRECTEEEIEAKIEALASQIRDFKTAVFNLHVPPYDSGLDLAPQLTPDLKPVVEGGEVKFVPVGSTAVRRAIERYQPLLGLHGHIHESRGFVKIGRTLCINPGSEYGEGILRGALIDIEDGKIKNYLLTQG